VIAEKIRSYREFEAFKAPDALLYQQSQISFLFSNNQTGKMPLPT